MEIQRETEGQRQKVRERHREPSTPAVMPGGLALLAGLGTGSRRTHVGTPALRGWGGGSQKACPWAARHPEPPTLRRRKTSWTRAALLLGAGPVLNSSVLDSLSC